MDKIVIINTAVTVKICILQTVNEFSIPAKINMIDAGINILVTNRSAKAMLTINAFPINKWERGKNGRM